jgi:hypothetical protein
MHLHPVMPLPLGLALAAKADDVDVEPRVEERLGLALHPCLSQGVVPVDDHAMARAAAIR